MENSNSQALRRQLLLSLGNDENDLEAIQFRDNRLPRLNARGVAMTMALSRLLLLIQYAVGTWLCLSCQRGSFNDPYRC